MYADGGSRGNPGPAASGAVIKALEDGVEGEILGEAMKYLGVATNNQAEYTAIIIGLEKAIELGAKEVDVRLDSQLAVKQLNGEYRVKDQKLAKLFVQVKNLLHEFDKVVFSHVYREKNKEADALVNKCLDAEDC